MKLSVSNMEGWQMSSEHGRALWELRQFREQVKTFQGLVSGHPSDARPPMSRVGVMQPPTTHNRTEFNAAVNALLDAIGIYEIRLQSIG
jgi:hypothetical protein